MSARALVFEDRYFLHMHPTSYSPLKAKSLTPSFKALEAHGGSEAPPDAEVALQVPPKAGTLPSCLRTKSDKSQATRRGKRVQFALNSASQQLELRLRSHL
eukprot:Sspe_Gene.92271::Locus_64233_Transcript_1_2_Confidence_0.750_Length_501::g.92271::m.92271